MSLTVCTARLTYGGPGRLDITRKGADEARAKGFVSDGAIFAPSHRIRALLYRDEFTTDQYMTEYRAELERAYHHRPYRVVFDGFLVNGLYGDRIVGVCYCAPDADGVLRCHRTTWRSFMVEKGAIDGGELPSDEQRRVVAAPRQGRLF